MVLSLSIEEDKDVSVPSLHPNKLNNNEINIIAFLFIKSILSFRLRLLYFTMKKLSSQKKHTKNPKNYINSRQFVIKIKILSLYI